MGKGPVLRILEWEWPQCFDEIEVLDLEYAILLTKEGAELEMHTLVSEHAMVSNLLQFYTRR